MTRSRFSSNWWLVVYILLLLEPCAYSAPGGGTHERDVHDDAVKEATEALARAKDKARAATLAMDRVDAGVSKGIAPKTESTGSECQTASNDGQSAACNTAPVSELRPSKDSPQVTPPPPQPRPRPAPVPVPALDQVMNLPEHPNGQPWKTMTLQDGTKIDLETGAVVPVEGSTRICPPKGTKQPEGCNPAENQFFINGVYVSEDQARVIIADLKKQLKVETDRMKDNERRLNVQRKKLKQLKLREKQLLEEQIKHPERFTPAAREAGRRIRQDKKRRDDRAAEGDRLGAAADVIAEMSYGGIAASTLITAVMRRGLSQISGAHWMRSLIGIDHRRRHDAMLRWR